jgi:S1-C subfamily serine protease
MKAIVALTLAFLLLPVSACAQSWADVVGRVDPSLARIEFTAVVPTWFGGTQEVKASCTAFSINEQYGYFMTAAHCLNNGTTETLTLDGFPARLLYREVMLDLAVIAADLHKPAMVPSAAVLRKGDEIATLGYGYGLHDSLFRAGHVANPLVDLAQFELPNLWLAFDNGYIGGMSGGPVFDRDGYVVGLVQLSDEYSGFGITIATILEETSAFWEFSQT